MALADSPGRREYEIACDHDRHGREAEAIPHYERALALGLGADDRRCALVGLGSSLRNVARHEEAVVLLTAATREFPEDPAIEAFLGLALYSAGDARAAVVRLLDVVVRHAPVGRYVRALGAYRDDLR